jgi:DNA invertase Pin-like site-specific DNA recombinase
MRICYSYLRYSSEIQGSGDSIRRQLAAGKAWCERHESQLDTATTFEDRGKSAYHGRHRTKGVLATFLGDVEQGRIPRGSVLLLENLDRLSRESPWDAVPLLCSIVNAGITVVTLSPSEMTYERGRDLTPLILAVVEFGRGHSESAIKAERLSSFWREKQRQAREEKQIVTRRLPGWICERKGRLHLIRTNVRVVRQIFKMCIGGMGLSKIVKYLTDTTPPTLGRGKHWTKAYVKKILKNRAVLGEYQPKKDDKADGAPVAGYYPRAVTDEVFEQAQNAMAQRKDRPGRIGHKVASLFSGLLWDAQTHSKMLIAWQTRGLKGNRQKKRVLVNADSMDGKAKSTSFPYDVFEPAVLSLLKEVNVKELLGEQPESKVDLLTIQHDGIKARIRAIEEKLTETDEEQDTFMGVLRSLNAKRQDVLTRLVAAQQREAHPVSGAWTEAKTLLAVAKDETKRLRLRELLRTIITEAWVLVVPIRSRRLCAVQFHFREGGRRDYLIDYHAAGRGREGGWEARSFASDDHEFDLRNPENALELERLLLKT